MAKNQKVDPESIVETVDEFGHHVRFELIDIVELNEVEYALLFPVDDEGYEDSEENQIVIMRLKQEGDNFTFEKIEDDNEFNEIADYITALTQEELANIPQDDQNKAE